MKLYWEYCGLLFTIFLISLLIFTCKQAPSDAPLIQTQITGKVTDAQDNHPIEGVQITTNPATSSFVTGSDGNYTIPDITPKQYTITAKKDGYNDNSITVTVLEGKTANGDIQLLKLSPELDVTPTTLDFETTKTDLSIFITNKGKVGTITWTITSNQTWVTISQTSGSTTTETDPVQVSVSRSNLAIGNYNAQLNIESDAGSKTVNILMTKPDPSAPQLSISPTNIDFGSSLTSSQVELKNTGTGTLTWTSYLSDNWISLSSSNGNISTGETSALTISVNKGGLAPGKYNGSVQFNSNGGSQILPVAMTVTQGVAPSSPTLSSPINGATEQPKSLMLSWNASSNATGYTLQVSTSSSFVNNIFNQTDIASTSQQLTGLSGAVTYYWRVNAKNNFGTSAWSTPTWSFTTTSGIAPNAPTLLSPNDGAINQSTSLTLSWNTSPGATSYTLQVSTSSIFANFVYNQIGLTSTNQQLSDLSNSTTYYWRVCSTNNNGNSNWSNTWSFTTNCVSSVTYEGKTYNTVQIGYQCWLKENLDVGTMINGSLNQINNGTIEKYCYNNDPNNCATYGGLYQWDEAMAYSKTSGSKGICPDGWHLPTSDEIQTLNKAVNYSSDALEAVGQGTGTDASGFSALFSGYRDNNGYFSDLKLNGTFSSSSESSNIYYYQGGSEHFFVTENLINLSARFTDLGYKEYGYSIRCIKDGPVLPPN